MNRKVLIAGAVIVLPVLLILAMSFRSDPTRIRSPLIGRTAPTFALRVAGTQETISLESLKGKPVVLNFWATWCVPCHEEHGVLTAAAALKNNDVQYVGVVYNDEEAKAIRFLQQYGGSYPSLLDPGATTAIAYGVYGVPETFFIDRTGKIVAKHEGPLTPDILQQRVNEVLR